MKIIIKNEAGISEKRAIECIYRVIKIGRISNTRGIKHYCWVTTWENGIVVYTRDKKTKDSPDSFIIRKENNN